MSENLGILECHNCDFSCGYNSLIASKMCPKCGGFLWRVGYESVRESTREAFAEMYEVPCETPRITKREITATADLIRIQTIETPKFTWGKKSP